MPIYTFERYEKKFLVSAEQEKRLTAFLTENMDMEFDAYCRDGKVYAIHNVYFDDENNSVINASLARPKFKEKLRLRSYECPKTGEEQVFLELKRKVRGIVTKRRATLSYNAAMDFVVRGIRPKTDSYSKNRMYDEIAYFLERKKVAPKVVISYEREALFSKTDPSLRVTFDRNIITRREQVDLMAGAWGEPLLPDGERLMEVKFLHAPPKVLCDFLTDEKIFMQSFSKYGNEYSRYRGREFLHLSDRRALEAKCKTACQQARNT